MALSASTDRFNGVLSTLAIKAPCAAVAIANITLSGEQTVNGVAVVAGDRVLVTAQTSAVDNGIYDVSSSAWTRSPDFDGNRDVVSGTFVTVATATVGRNPYYQVTTANPIVIGATEINFTLADGPNVSFEITAAEIAFGLTTADIDDSFEIGHLLRYGDNTIPDTTDMSPAAQNMFGANDGLSVLFPPGGPYKLASEITLPASVVVEATGALITAVSQSGTVFKRAEATADTSFAVSSQVVDTAVVTTTAPPTGLVAGDYVYLSTSSFGGNYPINLRRVASVGGSTVTLDHIIDIAYPGTVTLKKIVFTDDFVWRGGHIDCSGIAVTLDRIFDLNNYAHVTLSDIRVFDADLGTSSNASIFSIFRSRVAHCLRLIIEDCRAPAAGIDTNFCSRVTYDSCKTDGDFFGLNSRHPDDFIATACDLLGRFANGGTESVRGIKVQGCFNPNIFGNTVRQYDTAIRLTECANGSVVNNKLLYCGKGVEILDSTPDVASFSHHLVALNTIRKPQSAGISVGAENDYVAILMNKIYEAEAESIRASGDGISVIGNYIEEWDLGSGGSYAISFSNAKTLPSLCADNTLRTATSTKNAINFQTNSTLINVGRNYSNTDVLYTAHPLIPQFTAADVTPSVKGSETFLTSTTAVTITRFDDGNPGDERTLISKGATTYDTSTATRLIGSSQNIVTASGDVTIWVCEVGGTSSSVWRLKGFVDVSVDNSAGA